MVEQAARVGGASADRAPKTDIDERMIARWMAIGLPAATTVLAIVAGAMQGPPMAILVLAAGGLLGAIALLWTSLRVVSGDAELSPELQALDATGSGVDALASRKRMLLRALKDLDNERALGKLDADDHEQLSTQYRAELKDTLSLIDASLEPYRPKAEEAARAYLAKTGVGGKAAAKKAAKKAPEPEESEGDVSDESSGDVSDESSDDVAEKGKPEVASRVECAKCKTSNEVDAAFCKKCGGPLAQEGATAEASEVSSNDREEKTADEA